MPKLIFYFVQKEAGSDIQHPECFSIPIDREVTIRDVMESFPLSHLGNYHIRFRSNFGDGYQWIDPQEYDLPAPKYNGGVFLKVLNLDKLYKETSRIPIEESIPDVDYSSFEDTVDEEEEEVVNDMEFFDYSNEVEPTQEPTQDIPTEITSEPVKTEKQSIPVIKVDMDIKYVSRDDIQLDKDASKLTATSYEGKSATVVKAMKEREKQLRENQIRALMEKKERERVAVVNEEERDKAKQKYEEMLNAWSTDAGGEKKNIRTLLTTMHTVMWEGADFKPISMSDVLMPTKVKSAYRRAMLKVHPDKNQDASPEQKYIAQRIFDALNQAWNKFQETENAANPFMMPFCVC